MGREVDGVELRFKDGKVVDATATKNEEFMISVLDTDAGSRYLGEFAVGTNMGIQRFTKSILFDEKIGGTIHMAVGAGYPETGSKNNSAVHWDMICDMRNGGQIHVDGEVFLGAGFGELERDGAVAGVLAEAQAEGFERLGSVESPVTGLKAGNIEHLLGLRAPGGRSA